MIAEAYDSSELPDLLGVYYRRLFPYGPYYRWLNYGGVEKNYFVNREFSFTLKDDIYVRYQSFQNQADMEKEIQKCVPYKIDIGAVFSHKPNQHNSVKMGSFQALEKELVFDIDMTDYDDVRSCCSSADICPNCWPLMTIAIKVIDRALSEDFGFDHRLWVYSGRRGVHCWVCDIAARKLSQPARSAIAEYLTLVKGGEGMIKKVNLGENNNVHPSISAAVQVVERYFEEYALTKQDILGTEKAREKVLALLPDSMREELRKDLLIQPNSVIRWEVIKQKFSKGGGNIPARHCVSEVMLQYCYPRLDVNVSKGINHLLKSPFSIHPKTGRVCVPIDVARVDEFDPFTVPTISQICRELDRAVEPVTSPGQSKLEVERAKDGGAGDLAAKRRRDYKRTSMAASVRVFERFVDKLEASWKGELLKKSDLKKEF
ncbi:DNA primase small subunit [Lethenteron reissneri]|uniref:DNA primase small subunit n=1 Tax=Lethenteron reissneri TaxID=7753 RepID=UPI002AB5FCC4|nr:DNA primase small subunit [Lethenteron reissneri]